MTIFQPALRQASKLLLVLFCCMLSLTACGSKGDDPILPGSNGGSGSKTDEAASAQVDNTKALGPRNRVIYELNVGSFTQAGTFAAAADKLSELRTLGIDILWLMPIYPRGGGIDSPYAATDFQQTNPRYGTVADLRAMVAKAHELGMEVWLDWVPNHTATNAGWVKSHPEYYTRDQKGQMIHPNNYGDVFELNYKEQGLVDAMNACLKYWIDEADIDGYRCDYISSPTIPVSYWQQTIPMLKNYKPGKEIEMLGESDFSDPNNSRLKQSGFEYDYAWGFQGSTLRKQVGQGADASALLKGCQSFVSISKDLLNQHKVRRMVYLTNHDVNYNDGGAKLADMYGANRYALTALQFTIMGMPLLYNGQEIGGTQILDYFKDTKINWSYVDAKMKNTVRALIALRHTQPALADDVEPQFLTTQTSGSMAYAKTSGSNTVLVVLNLDANPQTIQVQGVPAGSYVQWIDSKEIGTQISTRTVSLGSTAAIQLDGKGYAVFVK